MITFNQSQYNTAPSYMVSDARPLCDNADVCLD